MSSSGEFYIGSCRYQSYFRKYFPPRLHTTKEVLQFLEKHNTISLSAPHVNILYGDCIHPMVRGQTEAYLAKPTLAGATTLCLEICSRKVGRLGDSYVNYFYVTRDSVPGVTLEVLDNATLMDDLQRIREIASRQFGITKVVLIPHINLRCRSGERIPERDSLYQFLVTEQREFEVIDITRYIERTRPELCLEDVLWDGYHYSASMGELARACIREYFVAKGC